MFGSLGAMEKDTQAIGGTAIDTRIHQCLIYCHRAHFTIVAREQAHDRENEQEERHHAQRRRCH